MTRLKEGWIKDISTTIYDYEKELILKTGRDFIALAAAASHVPREKIEQASRDTRVGVIPITTGLGKIGSFPESVEAILKCMKFDAFVTDNTDVAGIYEAYEKSASIIFLADDDKFLAINLKKNIIAENSYATARGFVAALEGAAGRLVDKEVLVIGCGIVGREVLAFLRDKGANPVAYDINNEILKDLDSEGYRILHDGSKISEYKLIIDATNQGGWIKKGMIHPEAWFITPGVPLSLDDEAYEYYKDRVIHDFLPIGVAVMVSITCK